MSDRCCVPRKLLTALVALAALHTPALQAQFDPERAYKQSAEVRQNYPDPQVAYDTPGFAPGRKDFTSHEEMLAYVEALRRRSDAVRVRMVGESQEGRAMPAIVLSGEGVQTVKLHCAGGSART